MTSLVRIPQSYFTKPEKSRLDDSMAGEQVPLGQEFPLRIKAVGRISVQQDVWCELVLHLLLHFTCIQGEN